MSKWIRRGDRVLVIAGNSKGKSGEVLSRRGDRVVVKDVNVRKKHMKKTQESQGGRIVEMEMAIHISNVCICNQDGKALKIRCRINKEGSKELIFGEKGKETVLRSVK